MTNINTKEKIKHGVLLANVGSPDAPTPKALRSYLRQFLSDKRVIDLPRWKWYPILFGIVLVFRPKTSAALYKTVWTEKGSPLINTVKEQAQGIALRLKNLNHEGISLEIGMGYGKPSLKSAINNLLSQGCTHITCLPLFPQYSRTTTASIHDEFTKVLDLENGETKNDNGIETTFIERYSESTLYRQALAKSVKEALKKLSDDTHLVISFHGIPVRYTEKGDPYISECQNTYNNLIVDAELPPESCSLGFQSRFGREPWHEPYLDDLLIRLVKGGKKNIAVVCPAFSADCLETLSEIDIEYREVFDEAGGDTFTYIPSLNANPDHLDALTEILSNTLKNNA
jgi:ferrochelatase